MATSNAVATLLAATSTLGKLRSFVQSGDEVAEVLAEPLMRAARAAFLKVPHASNPEAQLWSAVNHLEAAHETLRPLCRRRSSLSFESRHLFRERMANKDKFVLCLMACCYKVLGEEKLSSDAIVEAEGLDAMRYTGLAGLRVLNVIDPTYWSEGFRFFVGETASVDVEEFRNALERL